jgi:hypothetical protein
MSGTWCEHIERGTNVIATAGSPCPPPGRSRYRGEMRRHLAFLVVVVVLAIASCPTSVSGAARSATSTSGSGGISGQLPSWSAVAPSLSARLDPSSGNICSRGAPKCLEVIIAEMTRRFNVRAAACDHAAMFALAYLNTTRALRDSQRSKPHPASDAYMRHLDAVFARMYFTAADLYAAGRFDALPRAWQIAFDAAATRQVTGIGDLLLGLNAHAGRDLVFALTTVGLTLPDGTSAKPAFDAFNAVIASVQAPTLEEASRRFDPTVKTFDVSAIGVNNNTIGQVYGTWRDDAWANAEQILATPAANRAELEASVETNAATRALVIEGATHYVPFVNDTTARDQFCAAHGGR